MAKIEKIYQKYEKEKNVNVNFTYLKSKKSGTELQTFKLPRNE